jgi:curved DNA-binding protein CbpA
MTTILGTLTETEQDDLIRKTGYPLYYRDLCVSPTASEKEITKAYRNIQLKYHPDKNPDNKDATNISIAANNAYPVLLNSEQRKAYDNRLANLRNILNKAMVLVSVINVVIVLTKVFVAYKALSWGFSGIRTMISFVGRRIW